VLSETFIIIALFAGIMCGGLCAYLGNFILMRNMTFASIAISETAALGAAVGLLLGFAPSFMAFIFVLIVLLVFWSMSRNSIGMHESIIGVLYVFCAAAGIVIISQNPLIESHGVDFVSGNLLYCTVTDLVHMGVVILITAVIHFIFYKEFIFICFDRETATGLGIKVNRHDFVLLLTIGLCISFCIKLTGVLFVFASMIIPPLISLNIFKKIKNIFVSSVIIVSFCIICGLIVSYKYDLPTSPVIICVYGAVYMLTYIFRRKI